MRCNDFLGYFSRIVQTATLFHSGSAYSLPTPCPVATMRFLEIPYCAMSRFCTASARNCAMRMFADKLPPGEA